MADQKEGGREGTDGGKDAGGRVETQRLTASKLYFHDNDIGKSFLRMAGEAP